MLTLVRGFGALAAVTGENIKVSFFVLVSPKLKGIFKRCLFGFSKNVFVKIHCLNLIIIATLQ